MLLITGNGPLMYFDIEDFPAKLSLIGELKVAEKELYGRIILVDSDRLIVRHYDYNSKIFSMVLVSERA